MFFKIDKNSQYAQENTCIGVSQKSYKTEGKQIGANLDFLSIEFY